MPKVLYVATVVKTHIMEFHVPYLKMLKDMGWETAVAARNDYEDPSDCVIPYCDEYFDVPFERNPLKPGNIRAYHQLKDIVEEGNYDIVHVHTPVGAMLGRLAARAWRREGKTTIVYTAHGFHFFKGAPPLNWLVYFPVEWACSWLTDVLITINKEDYERAKRLLHAKEIIYVPGVGIDVERFAPKPGVREAMRAELGLADDDYALLSVGELIPRKNHRVVIHALGRLKERGELGNLRYIVCGHGPLKETLESLARDIGVGESVSLLGYRDDVPKVMAACDTFVFPSLQEGLPVAVMEAMAAGLPVICPKIRGCVDLVQDGVTGLLLEKSDAECVAAQIGRLIHDPELRSLLAAHARLHVREFDLEHALLAVASVYETVLCDTKRQGGRNSVRL